MISEIQISELIARIHTWGKQENTAYKKEDKERAKYFSDVHMNISELKLSVSYHADYGVFPEKLILDAAPNETDPEFNYRKKNYKQITKPIWDKALGQTYRIFNPQNYHTNWKEQEYEDFFLYTYPLYGSYPQFFKDVVHAMKFADPNSVLACKPQFIPGDFTEEGEFIVDQSEPITPIAELYTADQCFEYREGNYALLLTKYYSPITVGNKEVDEGLVFEIYDDTNIYRVYQIGKKEDWDFEYYLYYRHGWESMPAWKLKGKRVYHPIETLYYSHFMCAVPNLDMAAIYNSTQFGVINKVAYPTRWYFEDECDTCNGSKFIHDYELGTNTTCNVCHGTGKKFTFSWGKDYKIPMPQNLTDTDTQQLPTPPIGDHSPSLSAPEFLETKIEKLLSTAFTNLNIEVTEQPTGVSATEVKDDQENKYTFLLQITDEEFDLLQNSLDAQAYMRWGEKYEGDRIEITPPSEFSIRSSYELTDEYKTAIEAKMPVIFQKKILEENLKQRFKGDTEMEKILQIVIAVDPLMTKTDMEVSALVNSQIIPKWRAVLHHFIYQFIEELNIDGKFFDKDPADQKKELEAMAKTLASETDVNTADSILQSIPKLAPQN